MMNDKELTQLEGWAKGMDCVGDGDKVLELVDEVRRLREEVEYLKGEKGLLLRMIFLGDE